MFAHMPAENARIGIEAAAGAKADNQPNRFAFKERLLGISRRFTPENKTDH
jgi:hypothetical protein